MAGGLNCPPIGLVANASDTRYVEVNMFDDVIDVTDTLSFSRSWWNSLSLDEQLQALREAIYVQRQLECVKSVDFIKENLDV